MSKGTLTTASKGLPVALSDVSELARGSLGQFGWTNIFINERLREITAEKKHAQKAGGATWNSDYHLWLTWKSAEEDIFLKVVIEDFEHRAHEIDCKQLCAEVIGGMFARAEVMKEADAAKEIPTTHGSARWGTTKELEKYLVEEQDSNRLYLGRTKDTKQEVSLTKEDAERHMFVVGPTGSGKSMGFFKPNLFKRLKSSAIVTEATAGDESPDLYETTAGFRHEKAGHQIFTFNPDDLYSHRLNPVDSIGGDIEEAQRVASLIIENTTKKGSGGGDKFWISAEEHLLKSLLLYASDEGGHLGMVRALLCEGAEAVGEIIAAGGSKRAKSEYLAFYKNISETTRNGVVIGLMVRLNLWANPRVVTLTEKTDLVLKDLPKNLFTFYLSVPSQKHYLKPLSALAFNYIFEVFLNLKGDPDVPLWLALDELTNFGAIPALADKLSIIRKRHFGSILGVQDYSQLELVYDRLEADVIWRQPASRAFFRPNDDVMATRISKTLGNKTEVERLVTSSGQISYREFPRPLMHSDEVQQLQNGTAIVFTPGAPPVSLDIYSWQEYEQEMKIKPPPRRKLEVREDITDLCKKAAQKPDWVREMEEQKAPELDYVEKHYKQEEDPDVAAPI